MKLKSYAIMCLLALLSTGCAAIGGPFSPRPSVVKLAEKFSIITGTIAAPPKLMNGNRRLLVFLAEEPEPEKPNDKVAQNADGSAVTDTNEQVLSIPRVDKQVPKVVSMCVAENADNKQVLINIEAYLSDPKAASKPIIIYGKRLDSAWNEYVTGINCYINAISFYVPETGTYAIVTTDYGDGLLDQTDWKSFVVMVGKTAIKFAK